MEWWPLDLERSVWRIEFGILSVGLWLIEFEWWIAGGFGNWERASGCFWWELELWENILLVVGREKEKICFAAFGWLKFLALSIKNPFLYFNNHIFILTKMMSYIQIFLFFENPFSILIIIYSFDILKKKINDLINANKK